jgi:hypothetical protein
LAALTGVWLTARLTARGRQAEAEREERKDALGAVAGLMSIVVDADPTLILAGDLREYDTPAEAIEGLYGRWRAAREPLVLLSLSYPSEEGRHLAFNAQAKLEIALRLTDDARKSPGADITHARAALSECAESLQRLARTISALRYPDSGRNALTPAP